MRLLLTFALALTTATANAATFGDQTAYGTNFAARDNIGALPASPAQSGVCDSITAYVKFNLDSCKMRCALYTISGNDTVLVANGLTVERRFEATAVFTWQGFAFPNPRPVVNAGQTYFIALFADTAGSAGNGLPRGASAAGGGSVVTRTHSYASGYPSPLNPSTSISNSRLSIYATYTPTTQTPPRRRHVCQPRNASRW